MKDGFLTRIAVKLSLCNRQSAALEMPFTRTMPRPLITILLIAVLAAGAAGQDTAAASAYLHNVMADPEMSPIVMMSLRTTGDKELLPLFVALTRSSDKRVRLFATSSIAELADADAAPALLERLDSDPAMAVRAEAIAQLLALDAIPLGQLVEALDIPDENVQLIAARALVHKDNFAAAVGALERLTGSNDKNIAAVARLILLASGDSRQLPHLREFVAGLDTNNTSPEVVGLLLGQIEEFHIAPAADVARDVLAMNISSAMKIQAWRALSATSDEVTDQLADAIRNTQQMPVKVQLLKILASRSDAPRQLARFVDSDDEAIAALSQFELSRLGGASDAADVTRAAMDLRHPVIVAYVLDQAARDIAAGSANAGLYVPALISYLRSVRAEANLMELGHFQAARAATLLANHGSDEALAALKEILSQRYNALVRATAAGVLKSVNPAVCDLMRPLLTSPYPELSGDAALTLGKFGDRDAVTRLNEIVARPERYEPALVVLASWYLLKADQQGLATIESLAQTVQ